MPSFVVHFTGRVTQKEKEKLNELIVFFQAPAFSTSLLTRLPPASLSLSSEEAAMTVTV